MPGTHLAGTAPQTPPLVPEVELRLIEGGLSLEAFRSAFAGDYGAAPPYWAVAWPGGQALARFVLDNPSHVRGRRIVDMGSGSGLAAIAAARAGASEVFALDRDPNAIAAIRLNACSNDVLLTAVEAEFEPDADHRADTVLAGDLWYDRFDARRATASLRRLAAAGADVLIGDTGRSYFPRRSIEPLASYRLDASTEMEQAGRITSGVWRMLPHAEDA